MENLPKMTVSELTRIIKTTLEGSFFGLTIEGEISGFKPASTGHWYFSIKDDKALINAAIWKSTVPRIGFVPKDGQKVVVTGSLSLYEPRGSYQIICSSMRPAGEGDILAQLEERKRKYLAMGWFDESLKKPIPKSPSRVALVTSETGAALQDMLQVTERRSTTMDIIILPATVQGENAGKTIAARIEEINKFELADVMIVGRGGGSLEDLLPFSEDCVIEAIHNSHIPVISAVGHEVDWALSDFVADLRAPTPSAAAELVCEATIDRREKLLSQKLNLEKEISSRLTRARLEATKLSSGKIIADLKGRISTERFTLDSLIHQLENENFTKLSQEKNNFLVLVSKLKALSPMSVLARGYSIISDKDGVTIRNIEKRKPGEIIKIKTYTGSALAELKEV